MTTVHVRELLAAAAGGGGVLAFNVITLEHAQGIIEGAERAGQHVILQLSENAIRYHGSPDAIAAGMRTLAAASEVAVGLHLDHITDAALARRAGELGFSSVMFDASQYPYQENTTRTREVVEWARASDIVVEAELGEIGGKDGAHAPGVRTDPSEAREFVTATGVDSLAVAVGSSHAMTEKSAQLDHALIAALAAALDVPLVLHGSSGIPDDQLRRAIAAGMVKINVGTALNIAFTQAVSSEMAAAPQRVDPRRYLAAGREAIAVEVRRILDEVTAPA